MENATAETQAVDHDTSHFKGVRRGFDGDLYISEFIPFTADDFDWKLTDVYESDRNASCSLQGTPNENAEQHIELLATNNWGGTGIYRDNEGLYRDKPMAWKNLRVAWHYKGCRTEEQKRKRKDDALDELRAARNIALGNGELPDAKRMACEKFNERMRDVVEEFNREYVRTWVRALTEGKHRDAWVLDHEGVDVHADTVAEYRKTAEREERLSIAVAELRDQLNAVRNEQHKRYEGLALQRMRDDNWTDNEKLALPVEVVEQATEALLNSKRKGRMRHPFAD
jgi:hypothetical protein